MSPDKCIQMFNTYISQVNRYFPAPLKSSLMPFWRIFLLQRQPFCGLPPLTVFLTILECHVNEIIHWPVQILLLSIMLSILLHVSVICYFLLLSSVEFYDCSTICSPLDFLVVFWLGLSEMKHLWISPFVDICFNFLG